MPLAVGGAILRTLPHHQVHRWCKRVARAAVKLEVHSANECLLQAEKGCVTSLSSAGCQVGLLSGPQSVYDRTQGCLRIQRYANANYGTQCAPFGNGTQFAAARGIIIGEKVTAEKRRHKSTRKKQKQDFIQKSTCMDTKYEYLGAETVKEGNTLDHHRVLRRAAVPTHYVFRTPEAV